MLFNSLHFLVFFPIVTLLFYLLKHKYRWILLFIASTYFYSAFFLPYIFILYFIIIIDYVCGILIENSKKIKPITEINFIDELKKNNSNFTYNGELKNFGVVINTDLSTNGGIHWFSIFIDFTVTPITIEYFNSSFLLKILLSLHLIILCKC